MATFTWTIHKHQDKNLVDYWREASTVGDAKARARCLAVEYMEAQGVPAMTIDVQGWHYTSIHGDAAWIIRDPQSNDVLATVKVDYSR